jgi:hypothetical protein
MRWLILYARSRQVPTSAAAVALVTAAAWAFAQDDAGPVNPGIAVLILTASVAAASVGLGGRDTALDRTAAIWWIPRRAAHVLLTGTVAGAALLAVQTAGTELAPAPLVVRDSAGLAGLAALGAVLCGARFAWTLPVGWVAFTLLVPAVPGTAGEVSGWMIIYPATTASTTTAWALLTTGTVLYATAGPKP